MVAPERRGEEELLQVARIRSEEVRAPTGRPAVLRRSKQGAELHSGLVSSTSCLAKND